MLGRSAFATRGDDGSGVTGTPPIWLAPLVKYVKVGATAVRTKHLVVVAAPRVCVSVWQVPL